MPRSIRRGPEGVTIIKEEADSPGTGITEQKQFQETEKEKRWTFRS